MKKTDAARYLASVKRKPAPSENALQEAVVRWARGIGHSIVRGRFTASANGWTVPGASPRDRAIQGAKLKQRGVRNGWPDLEFISCRNGFGEPVGITLFLEMKLGTQGVLSPAQREVHDMLRENGHMVMVARDLAQAIRYITDFYKLK